MTKLYSIFVLTLLAPWLATAQTVYTWEDEQGVIHFSDFPETNAAKALTLPTLESTTPPPTFEDLPTTAQQAKPESSQKQPDQPKQSEPLSLAFESPQNEQTIRSNQGRINITAQKNRKLKVGEQLQLILDDSPYDAPNNTGKWQLKDIDRGTHTFSIQAFRDGKLIASSSTITVHLHRSSIK
ncbi:DUF4124 domain-containing protein [Vibrio sp. 10N.261.55.A7]|uniref:DUF4124 domain-containing protein n=1 Tax=Vibrio sp. 10N.261.55.A7 TaxID=1880851 RepID=UPI000C864FA5|nr:DUF4124 domain-containing protein [Vibrio sp. 10N.261.55.A7]PMK02780.1 hypothetical protein BCU12_18115 [Vibrio sp. 10N.261.55.A7]